MYRCLKMLLATFFALVILLPLSGCGSISAPTGPAASTGSAASTGATASTVSTASTASAE